MLWVNVLAVFFVLNKAALSWKGTPYGQVTCDSSLKCLLMSSQSGALKRMQATAPAGDINTWYPIPKWKVFFDSNKNRNEYSSRYFNKLDPSGTDGNIYDNDFPRKQEPKKSTEVFERLNIQFLPLKDGNITVKGFQGKINDNRTEYVALFVVYAHSSNMDITRTSGDTVTEELKVELMNRKENMNSVCDEPDGCLRNVSLVFPFSLNSSVTENKLFPVGEKVVSIPVTKNMSIEIKTGELDTNNYTVMFLPFDKMINETTVASGEMKVNTSEIINLTLTKNMNMVVNVGDFINYKENNNFTEDSSSSMKNLNTDRIKSEEITENYVAKNESNNISGLSDVTSKENITEITSSYTDITSTYIDITSTSTENTKNFHKEINTEMVNGTIENVSSNIIIEDVPITPVFEQFENIDNSTFNVSSEMEHLIQILNNTKEFKGYDINMSLPASNESDTRIVLDMQPNDNFGMNKEGNYSTSMRKPKSDLIPLKTIYTKQFGPYEVKKINSNQSSFIATVHLTINDKLTKPKNSIEFSINTRKLNNSDNSKNNSTKILFRKTFQRRKRNASNENSNERNKLYHRIYNIKQKIISNGYFSHENEISNKYSNRTSRMILNKAEETTPAEGTMNHFSLILPGEGTQEQSNSSRLFLFSGGPDSYSYATISNGNEEFNQKSTDKFRNKGLIANEISDKAVGADRTKSNQTAHGVRNKRELALPTLIPNKDSRENHSVSKKSELQIVEGASLDKRSDDWEMKIPPGTQYLRENGIKRGKICDLKDGCKGVSDVFNTRTESGYYKKFDVGKGSFDSNENLELKGRIDQSLGIPSHNFKRKMSREEFNAVGKNKKMNDEFDVGGKQILLSRKLSSDDSNLNSLQKHHILPTLTHSENLYTKSNLRNGPLHMDANSTNYETFGRNEFSKIDGNSINRRKRSLFYKEDTETVKMGKRINNYSKKITPSLVNLLRKKRYSSQILPIANNPTNMIYLMDLNPFPTQQFPRGVVTQIGNITLPSLGERKYEDDIRPNNILQLFHRSTANERGNTLQRDISSNPELKLKELWINRGWLPRDRRNKWHPGNHLNEQSATRSTMPEYKWIIIIPEFTEQIKPKPAMRLPTKGPVYDGMMQNPENQANPNREKEGDEWNNTEWVLTDTVNDPGKRKNVNTIRRPTEPTSVDIINRPNTHNFPTIQPPRKAVSGTTDSPKKNSQPESTTKPTRRPIPETAIKPMNPNFLTTRNPWIYDKPWDMSYWSVSQDPWKKYSTTPMMGGMAGGD